MNNSPDDAEDAMNDPGGYYDMSGYAHYKQPFPYQEAERARISTSFEVHTIDPGPKPRNQQREQQLAIAVATHVKRCGRVIVKPEVSQSNLPTGHDNPNGPCECGAWHTPGDFGPVPDFEFNTKYEG